MLGSYSDIPTLGIKPLTLVTSLGSAMLLNSATEERMKSNESVNRFLFRHLATNVKLQL